LMFIILFLPSYHHFIITLPPHSPSSLFTSSHFQIYKNRGFGRCLVFKKFPATLKKYHNDMKDEILIKPKSSSFRFFYDFWDVIFDVNFVIKYDCLKVERSKIKERETSTQLSYFLLIFSSHYHISFSFCVC